MTLTFLGTRGYIDAASDLHRMHSSLLVAHKGKAVLIDCGQDWLGKIGRLEVDAVVLTHAHPDHAWGLKDGAPAPVYATEQTWQAMEGFAIRDRRVIMPRKPKRIAGITFEAFPVEHSIRCPAVGYRVTAAGRRFFYAPDVVYITDRSEAMAGLDLYIGDAATIDRSMVRKRGGAIFGHVPVRTQLTWCAKEGVRQAVFTHCGTQVVNADPRQVQQKVLEMAAQRGVEGRLAFDGMELEL